MYSAGPDSEAETKTPEGESMSINRIVAVGAAAVLVGGAWALTTNWSALTGSEANEERLRPMIRAPKDVLERMKDKPVRLKGKGRIKYKGKKGSSIELSDVPTLAELGVTTDVGPRGGRRIESKFSDAQIRKAQEAAAKQPMSEAVQNLDGSQKPVGKKPKFGVKFDAIDASDCCTGTKFSAFVPPDPDIAVGPKHVIVVVNSSFEIYDKRGKSLSGPIQFATFFDPTVGGEVPGGGDPTPECTAFTEFQDTGIQVGAVFDPDVLYDAENDRFILGIDGDGDSFCIAATETGNPLGAWNRYGFPANVNGAFFDFPHMGIGANEIIIGSNQFGGSLPAGFEGRVFAVDKASLYGGTPINMVTREVKPASLSVNVKLDGTPQPAQTPVGDANYIMTEFFDGVVHSVYSWVDPFGADDFDLVGDVDLATASGVPCDNFTCFPLPWRQKGSPEILEGNDWRGQETKVSNGTLWTAQTISCNPGKGARNCVRWAQIDPTQVTPAPDQTAFPLDASVNGVIQSGVFASDFDDRSFPSIAANSCDSMAVGYSYGRSPGNAGGTWFPSIYVTGRAASDPLGYVGGERLLKKAKEAYTSFQDNGGNAAVRWGDYTGMALDPNGKTFWYVGEYARANTPNPSTNWGTFVGSVTIPGC